MSKSPSRSGRPRTPRRRATRPVRSPAMALREPFLIADLAAIAGVPCPCGTSRRAFLREDNRVCSVHRTEIRRDSRAHYHKTLTEVYYILDGAGEMELDGRRVPVKPGLAVLIRPGTRHRAAPAQGSMTALICVVPPFDPRDEWFE